MPRHLRRGVYLLPSLLTIGNMTLGFYAAVLAFDGRFSRAVMMIFFAAILDTFDGRIARMTNTATDFGREYDSLADVVTFGMAPALLVWQWGLNPLGRAGWLVCAFFLICNTTRLARFNVQTTKAEEPKSFIGLPTPAAAGAVTSPILLLPQLDQLEANLQIAMSLIMAGTMVVVGSLMVSTFRYWSFKELDLRRRWSYRALLPLAALLLVGVLEPKGFIFTAAVLYTPSGPLSWLRSHWKRQTKESLQPSPSVTEEAG